eukprot:CAMPEP_0197003120 /NCGR_PEP_ID=MMETSP1380-20130617/7482_1 /TAXON_ID=5936 /ORGANISM="Euplotes crassus, Strain CT5" /LENGTH=95 /DNA_ID=CAMNT_0042421535 /DNA_START=47 /DNA_END=334 /DNA_ORIENTATION=+
MGFQIGLGFGVDLGEVSGEGVLVTEVVFSSEFGLEEGFYGVVEFGEEFLLDGEVVVAKSEDCDVVFEGEASEFEIFFSCSSSFFIKFWHKGVILF